MKPSTLSTLIFAWLFLSTGVFAIVGALFSWDSRWLFEQEDVRKVLIPMADLLMAGPFSLIAAFGIRAGKKWGHVFGLATAGMYLYGSVQVYVLLFWQDTTLPLYLAIPPIFGVSIAIGYMFWVFRYIQLN
jgi:hypothetical protein